MLSEFVGLWPTLICLVGAFWYFTTRKPKNFPPGPKWLPIVGNALDLRKQSKRLNGDTFVYEKWAKEYNSPIVGVKLGNGLVVVVLSHALVHEVHNRPVFLGRPDTFFSRLRCMGNRLGITFTDGDFHNEQRNFLSRHLREVGYGRKPMDVQIELELDKMVETLLKSDSKPLWPGNFVFSSHVLNVLWTLVAGEMVESDDRRLERLIDLMAQRSKAFSMTGGILSDMPWLRYLAPEWSGFNLINTFNKEMCAFFMQTINEHKADYEDEKARDDFIYAFIKEMQAQQNESTNFTELQLIMIIVDLLIAGLSTVQTTLDFTIMAVAMNPLIQKRVHKEIESQLSGSPTVADRNRLPYVEAVTLEVFRFYSLFPLAGTRRTLEEASLGGFTIPKDTMVLTGLHAVHHDPNHWGDPEVFRPDRFLDANMKIVNTERLVPFGGGRRKCLGDQLARTCLFIFFAGVMQRFTVELPPPGYPQPDPILLPGINFSPRKYNVIFRPK